MGAFLDKPRTEKYNESGSGGGGIRYGLSSMQGWRIEMEDAHSAVLGIPGIGENISWFAVFDGHAGSRVSAHCSRHLLDCLTSISDFRDSIIAEKDIPEEEFKEKVTAGILYGFLELDEKLRRIPEVANGEDRSGTTAVCALITEKYIVLSNCGDSRGVISRQTSIPVLSTVDHKPSNPFELDRIINAGGSVTTQRVNGFLAVSRSLGDFDYKKLATKGPTEQLISPEPEFYIKTRENDLDEFLVLACDGVWDVMSNEDICQFIGSRMKVTDNLEVIANEVIDTCLHKGSHDNMSIIIIALPGAPKVCPEAVANDSELNSLITAHVQARTQEDPFIRPEILFQSLQDLNLPHIPPGGGLYSKKAFMEEALQEYGVKKDSASCDPNSMASLLFTNANRNGDHEDIS